MVETYTYIDIYYAIGLLALKDIVVVEGGYTSISLWIVFTGTYTYVALNCFPNVPERRQMLSIQKWIINGVQVLIVIKEGKC